LLWLYLQKETSFFTQKIKLLHFAPERFFKKKLSEYKDIDYLSADLKSSLADVQADIQNLPFADNSFDYIICIHVLEHIPDDRKAMREIYRVLKPNGKAIVMVPLRFNESHTFEDESIKTPEERTKFYGQSDHLRYYGLDIKDRLQASGLTVKVEDYVNRFDLAHRELYGLPKKDFIYICTKARSTDSLPHQE
jgi:SAM-dependent methyltransferase